MTSSADDACRPAALLDHRARSKSGNRNTAALKALALDHIDRHEAVENAKRRGNPGEVAIFQEIKRQQEWKRAWGRVLAPWHLARLPVVPLPPRPRLRAVSLNWVTALFAAFILVPAVALALAWPAATAVVRDLERAITCAQATGVFDATGQLIGGMPVEPQPACTSVTVPFPDDVAVQVAESVAAIEGGYRTDDIRVWGGHDVLGFVRGALARIGVLPGRGFSGPLLTTVENLLGEHGVSPWRKLQLILGTTRFVASHLPDNTSRARFIANHLPTIRQAGTPRAGMAGAALLFDGRPPQTAAEYCQLARAAGFPVWAVRDSVTAPAARSWATSVGPAAAACVRATAPNEQAVTQALNDLRAACGGTDLCMSPPPPPPGIPADMAERGLNAALIDIARDRLPRFVPLTPPGGLNLMVTDTLRLQDIEPGPVLETTILQDLHQTFAASMPEALHHLDRRLPRDACLSGQCAYRVDHAVVLAELEGDGDLAIRALDLNRHGAITGVPIQTDASRGWEVAPPRFGLGSTAKLLIFLASIEHGVERACSNPSGGDTCLGGTWMSLRTAIATSDSGAAQWLALRYPAEVIMMQNQLSDTAPGGDFSAFDAAFGIGRSAMTPIQAMTFMGALMGDGHGAVHLVPGHTLSAIDLTQAGIHATTLSEARQLFSAPLTDAGGTLAQASAMLRAEGMTPLMGKTGTHTENGVNLVRTSTIVFATPEGRVFVLHVSLTATETQHGLGGVSHGDLVALQRVAVRALSTNPR